MFKSSRNIRNFECIFTLHIPSINILKSKDPGRNLEEHGKEI